MHELKIQRIRVYIYIFHAPKFSIHVRNHDLYNSNNLAIWAKQKIT